MVRKPAAPHPRGDDGSNDLLILLASIMNFVIIKWGFCCRFIYCLMFIFICLTLSSLFAPARKFNERPRHAFGSFGGFLNEILQQSWCWINIWSVAKEGRTTWGVEPWKNASCLRKHMWMIPQCLLQSLQWVTTRPIFCFSYKRYRHYLLTNE